MRVIAGNVMRLLVLAALAGMALGSGQASVQGTQPVVSAPIPRQVPGGLD
jgi:hypothetical protein